nr:MAG TPA: hypothetical protein [Bacteriophage sp.]
MELPSAGLYFDNCSRALREAGAFVLLRLL